MASEQAPTEAAETLETTTTQTTEAKTLFGSNAGIIDPKVNVTLINEAIDACLKFTEKQQESKHRVLFGEQSTIQLLFSLQKTVHTKQPGILLPLAHSIIGDGEICIFVGEPAKDAKERIKSAKIPNVAKVIGLQKLRTNYNQVDEREKLAKSYDLFLCDKRIFTFMPGRLGKPFFKRRKFPIPVSLSKSVFVDRIVSARDSTIVRANGGTSISINVGYSNMEKQQIADNVVTVIQNLVKNHIQGKWKNVLAIHLKTLDSPAFPIYTHLPVVLQSKEGTKQN